VRRSPASGRAAAHSRDCSGELFVHGQLFGHGQVEEALAGGKQAADQRRVYAMAGDIEEAALFASLAQLLGHQIHRVMAAQAADVDEGRAEVLTNGVQKLKNWSQFRKRSPCWIAQLCCGVI
jgi:hypothetical protein